MRVLICDDHPVFAESLALLLRRAGHTVERVVISPDEAVAALRHTLVDVCLVDLHFADETVIGRLPDIRAGAPDASVIVLTGETDPVAVEEGLAAGADAYAHKGQELDEIIDLMVRVRRGERAVTGPAAAPSPVRRSPPKGPGGLLTAREREALAGLVRGENTTTLARSMGVSRNTVRTHVQGVLTKLGVGSQREAVLTAIKEGMVSVETGEWLV